MKRNIYIFKENGIAAMYGIGTFIESLKQCFRDTTYIVTIINLGSRINETCFSVMEDYNVIDIPKPRYFSPSKGESVYYKNLIYVLRLYITNNEKHIFFFNDICSAPMIPLLRTYYESSEIIFIIHYLSWTFEVQGNTTLFKSVISKSVEKLVTDSEKKIYESNKESLNVFNQVDKIICMSQYTKKILCEQLKINQGKIHLIYNGLEDNAKILSSEEKRSLKKELNFNETEKLILYVGRLDKNKGGRELIDAFRILLKKDLNCKLIIIGSGDDSLYFEQIKMIWPKVIFTGKLNRNLVYKFYQIADVGVLPSFSEQCSYVAIEMMMHGLQIIGTDSTGLSEMIVDGVNGYKVKLKEEKENVILDSNELSKLIEKVINTPTLQNRLSKKTKAYYLSNYTFDIMKKKYNDILRK